MKYFYCMTCGNRTLSFFECSACRVIICPECNYSGPAEHYDNCDFTE
jgi:hypothetical protein